MLTRRIRDRIEAATVRLPRKKGLGVLVSGRVILTAAHCIDFTMDGSMVLGDHFPQLIRTGRGAELRVGPHAVEAVSDIAALGELDDQEFARDVESFWSLCSEIEPVPIRDNPLSGGQKVYIYTHEERWVVGMCNYDTPPVTSMHVRLEDPIGAGTSGGPIVDETGELIAIVNQRVKGETPLGVKHGAIGTLVNIALPVWLIERIKATQP